MQGPSASDDDNAHIAAINIIPLVDVVLVLLIIFMITAVFSREAAMKLALPKASTMLPAKPPIQLTVNVTSTGDITINGTPTTIDDVQSKINAMKSSDPDRKTLVVLRGDKGATYGKIIPVLEEVGQTNLDMTLATNK